MNVTLVPGKYVVAVSGGVDSMVLLDILAPQSHLDLIVAHFEHGIRDDGGEDLQLVEAAAQRYGFPFVYAHGALGAGASEAAARDARYAFLRTVLQEHQAVAIVTAHHQDDVLETAILNMARGTGRRGLSSLRSTNTIRRPLLDISRQAIVEYARTHHVAWREDATNSDERYLRNYIRRVVMPTMTTAQRAELLRRIHEASRLNQAIDDILTLLIEGTALDRQLFIMLPYAVSCELLAAWFRQVQVPFDRRAINRLTVFTKTAMPGKVADIDGHYFLQISKDHINLRTRVSRG
jgi:tRNA(Ile)-lysidine synthase